jgi:hypothetical protein
MALPLLIPVAIRLAAEFLPTLAAKIAGENAEKVARAVVETATGVAGLPENAKPAEIIEAIRGNPQAMEEIRYRFEQLNQQEHERILDDRQKAREHQERMGESGRRRGDIMLIGVSIGLAVCVAVVLAPGLIKEGAKLDTGELALVTTIAGALLKMMSDAFAFEFGSSSGSKEKDRLIGDFKEALVRVGEERQTAARETTREIIRNQQEGLATVTRAFVKTVGAANGAAPTATAANQPPPPRDFVADLIAGRI